MCGPRTVYLCKDWADLPQSPMRRCGGRVKSAAVGIILRGGPGHETGDRDCHRSTAGVLHHRHQRGLRHQRRNGPNGRRPELLIQRPRKCLARRALRGHPKAMRRKIFRQLLRRQAVVGDVRKTFPIAPWQCLFTKFGKTSATTAAYCPGYVSPVRMARRFANSYTGMPGAPLGSRPAAISRQ